MYAKSVDKNIDNLTPIVIEEIVAYSLLKSDCYMILKRKNKAIIYKKTSDFFTEDEITHVKEKKINLSIDKSQNDSLQAKTQELVDANRNILAKDISEHEILEILRSEMAIWARDVFKGKNEALELVPFWGESLLGPYPPKVLDYIRNTSVDVYARSLFLSSIYSLFLMFAGYVDLEFLKKMRNTAFAVDIGTEENVSTRVIDNIGHSEDKLDHLTDNERKFIIDHPQKSLEKFKQLFAGEEMGNRARDLILYHHKKQDNKGYPENINGWSLDDTIVVFGFVNDWVPENIITGTWNSILDNKNRFAFSAGGKILNTIDFIGREAA